MKKYLTPNSIIYAFLLTAVFFLSIFRITDNDTWWHLKTGEYIVKHFSIPSIDIFSYTIYGKPWLAFEWFSQVLLYCVYFIGGLTGLTLFKAAAVVLIFALALRSARSKDIILTATIAALSFLVLRDGLRERPQLFTYFFAAAYTYIFRAKTKPLFLIPLLQVFWANMHGPASLIGVGLTALYVVFDDALNAERKAYLFFGTAAAFFITPHGLGNIHYLLGFFKNGFNQLILEYRPPVFTLNFITYYVFLLLAVAICARLIAQFFVSGGKETGYLRDALIIVFGATASLLAIRNIPIFVIITFPLIVDATAGILRRFRPVEPSGQDKLSRSFLAGAVIIAVFLTAARVSDINGKYAFGLGDAHKARYAVDFIKLKGIKGPVFNDYDFGGYLIWKLYPSNKVFIDGRLVEYGAGFVEQSFYFWKPKVWNKLEKEYGFTAAIVPQESYYTCRNLDDRKDWFLVYWDDGALVYVKDVPANKKLIKDFGYKFLRPNYSASYDYLKQFPYPQVRDEALHAVQMAPHSMRAKALNAWLVAQEKVNSRQ